MYVSCYHILPATTGDGGAKEKQGQSGGHAGGLRARSPDQLEAAEHQEVSTSVVCMHVVRVFMSIYVCVSSITSIYR